jgi:hypothetical protein
MEEKSNLIESLLDSATDYGKTSYELVKLKAIDKTSDVVSTVIPYSFVFVMIAAFMLFFNLGLAFWLGEMLGKIFYGFFIVAAFYLLVMAVVYFFMYKWLKKIISNFIIKQLLK